MMLAIPPNPGYNRGMKETQYTIINPFSHGAPIMENVPASRLDEMVKYFAWLIGIEASSLIIKETA